MPVRMKPSAKLSIEAQIAIAVLCALGMFAGSFVLAEGGFSHTPKRGIHSVFISGSQAYFVAAVFFAFSGLAALVLLRSAQAKSGHHVLAGVVYMAATCLMFAALRR